MPQHNKIHFLALLQSENKIQIPIEIRQHFKLAPGSFLKIHLQSTKNWINYEEFFARLSKDGRITVPWEVRGKLQITPGEILPVLFYLEDY